MSAAEPYVVQSTTSRGRQYAIYSDGTQRSRKVDQQGKPLEDWKQLESVPLEEPEPLQLHVVAHEQLEGEPFHWSLFAAQLGPDGKTRGQVWQVQGDAENMRYEHAKDVELFNTASFFWHQTVNSNLSDHDFAKIDRLARSEPPPRAKNRKHVTENCQGWLIRLLQRLVAEGIVDEDAVVSLQGRMDPI